MVDGEFKPNSLKHHFCAFLSAVPRELQAAVPSSLTALTPQLSGCETVKIPGNMVTLAEDTLKPFGQPEVD